MPLTNDDFIRVAKNTYTALKLQFSLESAEYFWRLGHSFDTIIDYFLTTDPSDAGNFGTVAVKKYRAGGGDWYDDYGWWCISGLKAYDSNLFDPNDQATFRGIALECWAQMADHAPFGWQRADQKTYADFAPLVDGGVWNEIVDSGCHPGGPNTLCGRQNTVTNGLYLVLAQRLFLDPKLPPDPAYRLAADQEFQFIETWFDPPQPPAPEVPVPLMNDFAPGRAFVRERVSTFKFGATDPDFRPDLAWAGDQGLILGGLVDRMRIVGKASKEYPGLLKTARKLLAGSKDYLAPTGAEMVLQPWAPGNAPGNDPNDYWTGPAVYMRYLLSAFQNEDLRADIQASDYQDFIRTNAEYVVNNPYRQQSDDEVVNLTNNLAFLVAAIVMLSVGA